MRAQEWLARASAARLDSAFARAREARANELRARDAGSARGARRAGRDLAGASAFADALAARWAPAAKNAARGAGAPGEGRGAARELDASGEGTQRGTSRETRYVVQKGDTLWGIGVRKLHVDPLQLARDNGVVDPRRLQPGQELVVRREVDEAARPIVASWYGPGFDWRPMANGDPYDRRALTVAHKSLPLGTEIELTNPRTGESVRARVTDRGPYVEGRDVDLSWELARRLDVLEPGVAKLVMRVVG